jgi:hypothetical protein
VVAFEVAVVVAAAHLARSVALRDRDLERGRDVAGVAEDGLDVDAVGDDELQEPVAEDLACVVDGDRPDAGDLARLARHGPATKEGREVDADAYRVRLGLARPSADLGEGHHGVEPVGVVGLVFAGAAGVFEAGSGERFECMKDLRDVFGRTAERSVHGEAVGRPATAPQSPRARCAATR